MVELLSPVGDFECLKAAVQNGADSVYFGADTFSARAFANNFNLEDLKEAITYAKIRGIKTNLTLNTLIKDDEFEDSLSLANYAYKCGIDAIIVQDLGLAKKLIDTYPDLPIHASTQMTVHNLNGALMLQHLGFKRIVLSRELSIDEIIYICKNVNVEVECFIHGALCISYSGQCLLSSMVGGRSGNRGKCAQPCRLPYELLEGDKKINSGYLLSTRDLCGLDFIPSLLDAGVKCLKIEGRMKSPEYVSTVTRIYRKYIDLYYSKEEFKINSKDKKDLLQVFNRGLSSSGHLDNEPNKNLIYKEKPNNMGLFLGIVERFNANKGHIKLKLKEPISIGDTISVQNESGTYTISELMDHNKNIDTTKTGQIVTIGRMKGNIKVGDKIYKISSKALNTIAKESYQSENRKINFYATVTIKKDTPISIRLTSCNDISLYKDLDLTCTLGTIPETALNRPLTKESVIKQISKTKSSPFNFKKINVILDDNMFIPKLSILNELRRTALSSIEEYAISKIHRNSDFITKEEVNKTVNILNDMRNVINNSNVIYNVPKTSLLLNILNLDFDYTKLDSVDEIYIPLKYFTQRKYSQILKTLSKKSNLYIYMPTIVKGNYKNLFYNHAEIAVKNYNVCGFVVSNICSIKLLHDLFDNINKDFKIIANYTFNVFNLYTVLELKKLGISRFTLSPELDKSTLINLCNYNYLEKELIVYGKAPVMNMNYCLLGETDKCFPKCSTKCITDNKYYLKDRLNMKFRILPDNIQTVTTIYNSKTTSISNKDYKVNYSRIDILDESIEEINAIINTVKSGDRLEGKEYTNGNLNREI